MKVKAKKPTDKHMNVVVIERVVGLACNYRTPESVQSAIDSYAYCSSSFPVHRIIEYVRRLEGLLRGEPQPGNMVLREMATHPVSICNGACRR